MKINKGDVVIFYTGWTKLIGKDDKRYGSVEPGLGIEGAQLPGVAQHRRWSAPTLGAWK